MSKIMKILGIGAFVLIIIIWYFYISFLSSIWNSPVWTVGGIIGVILSIFIFIIIIGISLILAVVGMVLMED
jgi:hypothetical protein